MSLGATRIGGLYPCHADFVTMEKIYIDFMCQSIRSTNPPPQPFKDKYGKS